MSQERFVRFKRVDDNNISYGEIDGELITPLKNAPWNGIVPDGNRINLEDVNLCSPVEPSKILCIGLNYAKHVNSEVAC